MAPVAIDNQRRNSIGFSINDSIGICVGDAGLAILEGAPDSIFPKFWADGFVSSGDQSKGDFGTVAVETLG